MRSSNVRYLMLSGVFGGIALGAIVLSRAAEAQTCASYTYTLTNGTTADASQVMSNFNAIRNCANTNLVASSGGTLTNGTLTGTTSIGIGQINGTGLGLGMSPANLIDITSATTNPRIMLSSTSTADTSYAELLISNGASLGIFRQFGANFVPNSSINRTNGTQIHAGGAGGLTLHSGSAPVYFAINGVEVARIDTSGQLGLGTTSPAVKLAVAGDIRTGTSGTYGCVQNFAGTALTGTCSSDARLKTITGSVTGILGKLSKLDLVHFKWNDVAAKVYRNSTAVKNTGFIAQSVQKVFPELVSQDEKGYQKLDYTTLQLYGIEAIKELKVENDRLSGENSELKSRFEANEKRLSELESRIGIRVATNDNLMVRMATMFGW